LLAVGRYGSVIIATFSVAGLLVIAFATAFRALAMSRSERIVSWLLVVAGLALSLVAFPADRPGVAPESWHAEIHNFAYPFIPSVLVSAAVLLALADPATRPRLRRASRLALPVLGLGLVATFIGSVAQLGRYFLFGGALAWLAALTRAVAREAD